MDVMIATLADYAYVTDGKPSVIGAFTELNRNGAPFPVVVPSMHVVFAFRMAPAEFNRPFDLTISFVDSHDNRQEVAKGTMSVTEPPRPDLPALFTNSFAIMSMVFTEPGHYRFDVKLGHYKTTRIPFYVHPAADPH